jgi:hypothetical protein
MVVVAAEVFVFAPGAVIVTVVLGSKEAALPESEGDDAAELSLAD